MNTASRGQHLFPSALVLLLSITVAYLSFTREPASAFLFPRLVSVVMLVLAAWNFYRAFQGLSRVGSGLSVEALKNIAPGLVVLAIYLFFAAKAMGFYLASTLAFFTLFTLYDPASLTNTKAWGKRIITTVLFMLVIYALFTLLLKVQTPRGIFL